MFDIMDMDDDKRNSLLQLTDSQMKVHCLNILCSAHRYCLCVFGCRMSLGSVTAIPTLTSTMRLLTRMISEGTVFLCYKWREN